MRRHRLAVLLAASAALALVLVAGALGQLDGPELQTIDARFSLRDTRPDDRIVVVVIDEDTFSELDRPTWPFSRRLHARAVDRLRQAGAGLLVYDVQFTEESPDPGADLALYDALDRKGGGLLATAESDDRGRTLVLGGDENLDAIGARAAASNLPADPKGVVRRYGARNGRLPTIAAQAAARLGRPLPPGAFTGGHAWIDFRGGPGTFRTVSFSDLVDGRVDPRLLRDRIVVVGASAASLQDLHPTSASRGRQMNGPEIQANAIATALDGNPLRPAPGWTGWALAVLLGAVAPLALLRFGPVGVAVAVPVAGGLGLGAAQALFGGGTIVSVAMPLTALIACTAASVVTGFVAEAAERRRMAELSERLEREVRARTAQLRETQLEIVHRLAVAAESRDGETGAHVERMSRLCEQVALALGWRLGDAEALRQASALHDVGKIGIPDSILLKAGRLDHDEWAVMRTHTALGAEILADSAIPLVRMAEQIALTHHERWDGTGYPAALRGDDIPVAGRIAAVCDVFDALVTERPYKVAWTAEAALEEVCRLSGTHFDPAVVDAFVSLDVLHPRGELIELIPLTPSRAVVT